MSKEPEKNPEDVIRQDGRYPMEAFNFLNDGLARAVKRVHGAGGKSRPRHVSGQDLAQSLREEALERWGLLAKTVLAKWNIHGTIDFGNMVYLLVDNNLMQKTEQDSLEDFRDVYDFDEAFNRFEMPEG